MLTFCVKQQKLNKCPSMYYLSVALETVLSSGGSLKSVMKLEVAKSNLRTSLGEQSDLNILACSPLCLIISSKAVADGAVIWSIISSVFFRAPRSSFGATTSRLFRKGNPEHQGRISYISLDGRKKVKGGWSQVVTKVCAWFFGFAL